MKKYSKEFLWKAWNVLERMHRRKKKEEKRTYGFSRDFIETINCVMNISMHKIVLVGKFTNFVYV